MDLANAFGSPIALTEAVDEGRYMVGVELQTEFSQLPMAEPVDLRDLVSEDPEPTKHWLKVILRNEAGEAMAGESYRVVLADGQEMEGELDQDGVAKIPDIPGGPCQWSFPRLHPDAWAAA